MSTNIFQVWDSAGRTVPFAVRRDNWSSDFYTIVERVECEKLPYGKAFGFSVSNGVYSDHYEYNAKWRRTGLIPCCGCYQWTLASGADLTIARPSDFDDKRLLRSSSILYFGRYRGRSIGEVLDIEPSYLIWAIANVDKFILSPSTMTEFERRSKSFRFAAEVKSINAKKMESLGPVTDTE